MFETVSIQDLPLKPVFLDPIFKEFNLMLKDMS